MSCLDTDATYSKVKGPVLPPERYHKQQEGHAHTEARVFGDRIHPDALTAR